MSISTKGRYGVLFMLDLALNGGARAVTLKDVSKRQGISEKYLWQVVNPLKSAGLITAVRGSRGGYTLARVPQSITLREIVVTLEGDHLLINGGAVGRSGNIENRVANEMWKEFEEGLMGQMEGLSLKALVDRKKEKDRTGVVSYDI